jgi:adenosylcobinamide-GDP ribazoletransferase
LAWSAFALAAACGLPPEIAALIAVAAAIWLTGALHEDGVADFADGVGGGRDREARLAIMRDSRIGTFGALALIVAIGLRILAVAEVGAGALLFAAFVATGAASRFAMAVALALMPPAQADGLGRGAGRPGTGALAGGLVVTVVCLAPLGQAAAAVGALMGLAAALTGLLAARRLGGQTGDVLGAVQVVAEVAGWLALVAVVAG